jgi:predicted MFS family arabinose efflux permease
VLAAAAALLSLANGGMEVILPLWVTKTLHWTPTRWALLRSTRFFAVTFGVIILGALSDRFGQIRVTRYCTLGMAACMILLAVSGASGLWVLVPLYGIMASTIYVNLNAWVQDISTRRQGTANAIYRGFGTAAGIVAPLLATSLAAWWGRYPLVIASLAGILLFKFMVLQSSTGEDDPAPLRSWREELSQLWNTYRVALRERHLMRYIHFSLVWLNLTAAAGAFMAIRFTQELHFSDRQFGLLCSSAGVLNLSLMALSIFFMDRLSLRVVHTVMGGLAGLGCMLMGVGDVPAVGVAGLLLYSAMITLFLSPMSIWISRAAGPASRTSAFSVHKIATAFYVSVAMFVVGLLEGRFGMRLVLLGSGILALVSSVGFLCLSEPPRSDASDSKPVVGSE